MWFCKKCNEISDDEDNRCWNCSTPNPDPNKTKAVSQRAVAEKPKEKTIATPLAQAEIQLSQGIATLDLNQRYKEAYTQAHAIVIFGSLTKKIAAGLLCSIVLISLVSAKNGDGNASMIAITGIAISCIVSIPVYVLGILVSAQGQTQIATLDTAVNSSRHLNNDQVLDILSTRFRL